MGLTRTYLVAARMAPAALAMCSAQLGAHAVISLKKEAHCGGWHNRQTKPRCLASFTPDPPAALRPRQSLLRLARSRPARRHGISSMRNMGRQLSFA